MCVNPFQFILEMRNYGIMIRDTELEKGFIDIVVIKFVAVITEFFFISLSIC